MNDSFAIQFWNSPPARRAEIPSGGGLASARGLAVIAGHVAARDSQEVISHVTKDKMQAEPTVGYLFGMKTFFTQVFENTVIMFYLFYRVSPKNWSFGI